MIKRIVLTGGPCAGKTTALAKIEQDLTERGYKVFIVGESATELIKSGISPVDKNGVGLYEFQKLIMIYQIQKENFYEKVANEFPHDKKVIIYDRGLFDNKSYITDRFGEILESASSYLNITLTENNIINRYDMVIHLVTVADGNAQNYTLENNTARTETVEQARIQDKKAMECWAMHDNLQIIDNCEEFNEKINRVLNTIHNFLGNPIPIKKERKFLLDNLITQEQLKNINYIETDIEQYYIDNGVSDKYERRLRKTTYKDGVNYYYSIQGKEKNGIKTIISERRLNKKEYDEILNSSKVISKLKKKRYSFVYNKQYFKLDSFDNFSLLEVVHMEGNKVLDFPHDINPIEEVTDDINYQNIILGSNNKNNKKLIKVRK